jgi:hypothetical protein
MQEQFPLLIYLRLGYTLFSSHIPPALPDGLLGGSAPHLQYLELFRIPFPALPRFLLAAPNLVHLVLEGMPHDWYTSPEATVTGLAVLASLKSFTMTFLGQAYQESRNTPPPTRTILPALTRFVFEGVSGYLEELLALIEAPLLDSIHITFFHLPIFDIAQLAQFTNHTTRIQALNEVHVEFDYYGIHVRSLPPTRSFDETSGLGISWGGLDRQPSHVVWIFTSVFPSVYMVESLYIYEIPRWQKLQDSTGNMQWLGFFHPFSAVKNLYASKEFVPRIAPALKELGERSTELLPNLENIFLEGLPPSGPIQKRIRKFIAARRLSGHPITVSLWERESEQDRV